MLALIPIVARLSVVRGMISTACTCLLPFTPGEECKDHAFRSVCLCVRARNSKTIAPIDSTFYTRRIIPMARSSSKMILITIWISTREFIKGFFTVAK